MEELLRRIEALEKENARLRARAEIEDLGARIADLTLCFRGDRIADELWSHSEDIRIEVGASGIYEGRQRVGWYYDKAPKAGRFAAVQLTTPHIGIDEDGQTAHALWMVIATEGDAGELGPEPPKNSVERELLSSTDNNGRRYRCEWVWQRMELSARREDGVWKVFSLHLWELFRSPYDESWVSWSSKRAPADGLRSESQFIPDSAAPAERRPPEFNASFASTGHWQYQTDALPPEPLLG